MVASPMSVMILKMELRRACACYVREDGRCDGDAVQVVPSELLFSYTARANGDSDLERE